MEFLLCLDGCTCLLKQVADAEEMMESKLGKRSESESVSS